MSTTAATAPAVSWNAATRLLAIGGRKPGAYRVAEIKTEGGRGFHLTKVLGGSDPEADGYAVFISAKGAGWHKCECRGFLRWGCCRHMTAVAGLIETNEL